MKCSEFVGATLHLTSALHVLAQNDTKEGMKEEAKLCLRMMLSMLRTSKDLLRCGPPAMLACSAWACAAGVAAAPAAGLAEAAGEVAEAGAVEDLKPTSVTKCNNWPDWPIIFVPFFFAPPPIFLGGIAPPTWTHMDLQRRHPAVQNVS